MVPVGTEVWCTGKQEEVIADLEEDGRRIIVARGGKGGRGNATFATPTVRFPLLAEAGEVGEEHTLRLELKLLADIGIIGAPNVGKSRLLAAVTEARPKVADYPFTTLEPVLGVVERSSGRFVMVDIPGLIKGAHRGAGLGHGFLRHVERTRVLVHMVDGSAEQPAEQWRAVNEELLLFNPALMAKPQVIVINKMDLPEARARMDGLRAQLASEKASLFFISAATGEGLNALMDRVTQEAATARMASQKNPASAIRQEPVALRPRSRRRPIRVQKQDGTYVVESVAASRIAPMVDRDNWEARMQFWGLLKRIGVVRALQEAGVAPGDTVRIGKVDWEWE